MELFPEEYPLLLTPLLDHKAQRVYGPHFLNLLVKMNRISFLTNWILTLLTNLLFWPHLNDMETTYKMFLHKALDGLRLRCVHFNLEPEITTGFYPQRVLC